ncbi:MAG TPA: homoserine kinase [Candidatus Methylacidiphilales bacterium]|nr:homoserine kinase [Candidatus Methylacidiphilales bacterium]
MSRSQVQIRVPASTSNLGPGFDCLGLGLQLYNTVTVSRLAQARPLHGMIAETAEAFFERAAGEKLASFPFAAKIEGDIPISRGLGSSVTVRLGILLGLAELVRETVSIPRDQILKLLIELEGHPDNAVPSFFGGFAICSRATAQAADGFGYTRVAVGPELSFVTLAPDLRLSTETARALLPKEVPFRHAVENSQRTARIAAAFCNRDYASLRGLFVDHLHQPFRETLVPGFAAILAAATEAGALGSFLSGAGSALMAITLGQADAIGTAMLDTAKKQGLPAKVLVLKADNEGAKVVE